MKRLSEHPVLLVKEPRLLRSETRTSRAEALTIEERFRAGGSDYREAFADIITQDRAMFALFGYLETIAPSPQPVLITGETGTGKELVAAALHRISRRPGQLVAVNVAGLDDTLFSDTLFGHARGAYTGADRLRDGLITAAAGGTLFLDEIGDLTTPSQVKLLRLVQDGTYYPLGADRPRQSCTRIVVATNCDLGQCVAAGAFRKDLYFRLRTHQLQLPPLRQRHNDIPLLLKHFIAEASRVLGKPAPGIPGSLPALLETYDFPGNLRELQSMVFDAVARHQEGPLSLESFKEAIGGKTSLLRDSQQNSTTAFTGLFPDRLPTLREAEEALTNEAMARAGGNQRIAACILGISRQALNKRLGRRRSSAHAI
jgi:two-component system, NtrC family, nitrogen regulation response regulator GlnG